MNFRELNGVSIRDAFIDFHKKNPNLYKEFEKQAFRAINAGRKKISAKMIINYIRWNVFLESSDSNFKINDAFQSYYSRLFISLHPEHADKLECRKLRNEQDGPYMLKDEHGQLYFV